MPLSWVTVLAMASATALATASEMPMKSQTGMMVMVPVIDGARDGICDGVGGAILKWGLSLEPKWRVGNATIDVRRLMLPRKPIVAHVPYISQ